MDRVLKLIIEDISVTRPEQICSQLHLNRDVVNSLLQEMERSKHIKIIKAGSGNVDVIVLKQPGRQFYNSSSYAAANNEPIDEDPGSSLARSNRKSLTWIIIAIVVIVLAIIGFTQGWFS
jgi:hypothetical protein